MTDFARRGWVRLRSHPDTLNWVHAAWGAAEQALKDPDLSHWYQCENTWFVGVDALPSDSQGRIGAGRALTDMAWSDLVPDLPLHRGQLSVIWQGYPKPRDGESASAFRYRQTRFGAHVDGLLPIGPQRQRMLREPHAYILGLPLNGVHEAAAPLIVWDKSHLIMQDAFRTALAGQAPQDWPDIDLTDTYQAARRAVFDTCAPIALPAKPGEATLLHRHCLHGMGAWEDSTPADESGRQIVYFRPEFTNIEDWLTAT